MIFCNYVCFIETCFLFLDQFLLEAIALDPGLKTNKKNLMGTGDSALADAHRHTDTDTDTDTDTHTHTHTHTHTNSQTQTHVPWQTFGYQKGTYTFQEVILFFSQGLNLCAQGCTL